MGSTRGVVPKKYLKSLREYLSALNVIGELIKIDREVDWDIACTPAYLFSTDVV